MRLQQALEKIVDAGRGKSPCHEVALGVLRFALPRWMPPFQADLHFTGHSGITGAFAFTCPKRGRILAGTLNQLEGRSRCYRMMIQAALAS